MKAFLAVCALGLVAGCADQAAPELSESDEARLGAELANYEQAGRTVDCVNSRDLRGNRSAGEAAIIFDGLGRRVWVNRPPAGCPSLEHGRALRTSTPSTRLCRGDIATVFDPVSGISYGSCGLGAFTPYERRPSAG
ncbi:hypothetical protein E2493_16165 [Sphingomonas parva]|uniref:Lipoprotein n=1 Tax=Sphingomonas parva TaxID=2555898 RepID=A0A4Y8ZML0_9SPHN|nr:hypothetical protein [Sphingomonas parva]TFI57238.1 hypothetical protein E2493_16165 [Sphingomonas parva]